MTTRTDVIAIAARIAWIAFYVALLALLVRTCARAWGVA